MKKKNNFWFVIEPYVYISLKHDSALLYNILDGEIIKTDKQEIMKLLIQIKHDPKGVTLISDSHLNAVNIKLFIEELRAKFMGDIINISLSKGKQIQFAPILKAC